ncbi:MAG TPA: TatD family hydrolase [Rugosibacter sp.]
MLIDTHCHLDAAEFDADREAVAQAARQAVVSVIVVPAVERANFGAVASVCREHPGCVAAYGIHPMFVARAREEDLDVLRETIFREKPIAVGEIGLDRFVAERDDAQQLYYFVEQLKIAQTVELPVLLHVRRAIDQVLQQLRRIGVRGGIAHAFNGSQQQAEEFIRLGFKLGFGGAMTFPRAHRIRKLAAMLPLSSIVLETDAPDMSPEWKVGARNTPGQLPRIAQTLALLREVPLSVIAEATTANAIKVLPGLARLV